MPKDLFSVSSFRTLGNGLLQNLFTLENNSREIVTILGLIVEMDSTAALATVAPALNLSKTTALPTGGTILTSVYRMGGNKQAQAIARGATASDGGVATAITATATTFLARELTMRLHTAVGQVLSYELTLISHTNPFDFLILKPGEAIVVAQNAGSPTTHFIVNCIWSEESQYNP